MKYPFTDLSASKRRPAVVLQPLRRHDMIICQISSRAYADPNALILQQDNFAEGGLPKVSYAQAGKLFTGNEALMTHYMGRLTENTVRKITHQVVELLRTGK